MPRTDAVRLANLRGKNIRTMADIEHRSIFGPVGRAFMAIEIISLLPRSKF